MASTRNLMKFTDIVRDHYRGPAYGQEFTTWYTKVQHGFSTAQVPLILKLWRTPSRKLPWLSPARMSPAGTLARGS